jgi:hypothetical protein
MVHKIFAPFAAIIVAQFLRKVNSFFAFLHMALDFGGVFAI